MKQTFILILCFLNIACLNAQSSKLEISKFEIGFGGTAELHYLNTDYSLRNIEPRLAALVGANIFILFNTEKKFQFRLNGHFDYKRVSFRGTYQIPPSGTIEEYGKIYFNSFDISALTLYNIELKDNKVFQPVFGFFTSFSENSGKGSGLSGSGDFSGGGIEFEDLPRLLGGQSEVSGDSRIFHAGVNVGLNYRTYMFNSPVEFMALAYLSPTNMFEVGIEYRDRPETNIIKGKYHHFTLGFNIPLKPHWD